MSSYYGKYPYNNGLLQNMQDELVQLKREYASIKKAYDTMPKSLTEAAAHVEAMKTAVGALKLIRFFLFLLMLLGLASIVWAVLAGGVLALFAGVGPVVWFIIGGIITMIISGLCFYGIAVSEIPEALVKLATAQAELDAASQRLYAESTAKA